MSFPALLTTAVPEKPGCDVYLGFMPLRLPPVFPKGFPSVLVQLGVRHFYTVIRHPSDDTCMYYDFLPANPEDPLVLVAALTGQRVKGIIREEKLEKPPRQKCWWVGKTHNRDGIESARDFNAQWDSRLSLCRHDCRHHTNGLVHHLTGKEDMISQLDLQRNTKGLEIDPESTIVDEDFLASISLAYPTLMK